MIRLGRLGGGAAVAALLAVLLLNVPTSGAVSGPPDLVFPFPPGQTWRITCGYADGHGCQHKDNEYNRYALDFQHVNGGKATEGQEVHAAASGRVSFAGWGGADSFGWYVRIDHGDGYETLYAHMQEQLAVAEGDPVAQGDVLGRASCTGNCTGPHIHFVLLHNGASVLPEPMCGETGFDDGQTHRACASRAGTTVPGDATCDGAANSVDAAVVLQFEAALAHSIPCPLAANVNWDAGIDAVDASLILQSDAGLIENPTPGGWTDGSPMPTPRTEVTSVLLKGVIYVIGGFPGANGNTDVVEAYDTATDSWSTKAPLPQRLDHAGAATVGGKVYVMGGYTSLFLGTISNAAYEYDPMKDTWRERAHLPLARSAAATVALDGKIYVLGGVGPQPTVPLVYDPAADAWAQLAPMSTAREHLAAAALDGKIYVIGGRQNVTENVNTLEAYDPASNDWQTLAPMPTARGGIAATVLAGRIHVVGGEDLAPGGTTFEEHQLYDPAAGAWRIAPPLPTARHSLTAQAANRRMYVIGGGPAPGLSQSGAVEIFSLKR